MYTILLPFQMICYVLLYSLFKSLIEVAVACNNTFLLGRYRPASTALRFRSFLSTGKRANAIVNFSWERQA